MSMESASTIGTNATFTADTDTVRPLIDFATGFTIPTAVSKQDRPVRIGSCVYGRYKGVFAYKVYGEFDAIGLRLDGTWYKYGDPFDSPQAAYEALLATEHVHWGD